MGTGIFDTKNEQTLTVLMPTPTPTLLPTATPTLLPPTNTTAPTKYQNTPTQIPSVLPTVPRITTLLAGNSGIPATPSGVLAASVSSMPTLVAGIAEEQKTTVSLWALVLIIGGIILLSSCGILVFILRKKGLLWNDTTNE